jgi:WD40 repeat protein
MSADGRRLAARTAHGTVRLLGTDPWREIAQIAAPLGQIDAAAFSPDGTTLALLVAETGQVSLWNDGTVIRTFNFPPASTVDTVASALAFSSDGRYLATSLGNNGGLIDLVTGVTRHGDGTPFVYVPTVNPENLTGGTAISKLAFSAGNSRLFVQTEYAVGNSGPSKRLSLRDPLSGQETVLFEAYASSLTGVAQSLDGRYLALSQANQPFVAPGLSVYRADTGSRVSYDSTFVGQVLGMSRDGQRVFALTDVGLTVLSTNDLQVITYFPWPADAKFLGVSPTDELVAAQGNSTSWWDPSTGEVIRTVPHPVDRIGWSADGRYAAGTGDPAALVRVFRTSDGAELCAPPPRGPAAPALATLGTTQAADGSATSADGSIAVTDEFVGHTHATNYTSLHVRQSVDGTVLRVFGANFEPRAIALSSPAADRLYTPAGPAVAVWCR